MKLDASNRYLDPTPGAIALDLAALGLNPPAAGNLDALARGFLGAQPDQVTGQDQAAFAALLDHEHLRGSDGVRPFLRAVR